ncbi:MAG: DEAD/DEAH box helicase [bacterium]
MGYERPTPVRQSAIPLVASGRDLMVQSQTGTGKTAAFGIPLIEALGDKAQGIGGLVLCPTRELAKQVADEFNRLGKHGRLRTVSVYGGASLEKQVAEMRFAHIVVGTPGRVLDHLRRRTLRLDKLRMLVLDEADEMLSMGFAQELDAIMRFVPDERQTLLFSATIPEDIKRYARRYMKEPEFLSLIEENVAADDVEHHYYMVSGVGRPRELVQVIEYEQPESAIIFTNTRQDSELVARYLQRQGYNAEYLNGDLPQRERERIMQLTKEKNLRFLCATDIAARGIDISELSHVINYVLPESPEVYIHRTGRTGRAGAKGTAISLIGPREIGVYYYLKRIYNVALQERSVPTQAEIELRREERRTDTLVEEILASVENPTPTPDQRAEVMRLLERDDAVEVVQALLTHYRQRGAAKPSGARFGGMLDEVPRPEKIAPGGRPQTLAGVADRVAMIQSAYRGPAPRRAKGEDAAVEAKPVAASAPVDEPVEAAAEVPVVEAAVEAAPVVEARAERSAPRAERSDPRADRVDFPRVERVSARSGRGQRVGGEAPVEPEAARVEVASPAPAAVEPVEAPRREETTPPGDEGPRRRRQRPSRMAADRELESSAPPPAPAVQSAPPAAVDVDDDLDADDDGELGRLFVSLGQRDGFDVESLREALADLGGLLPEDLREISLYPRHSYVMVEREFAEDLIAAVNGETLDGRTVRVEFARNA